MSNQINYKDLSEELSEVMSAVITVEPSPILKDNVKISITQDYAEGFVKVTADFNINKTNNGKAYDSILHELRVSMSYIKEYIKYEKNQATSKELRPDKDVVR